MNKHPEVRLVFGWQQCTKMVLGEKKMNASSLGEDDMLSGEGLSTQYLVLQPEYVSRGISWQRPSKMGPVCGKVRAGRDLDFNGAGGLHI